MSRMPPVDSITHIGTSLITALIAKASRVGIDLPQAVLGGA
jgi:hypothetical protein